MDSYCLKAPLPCKALKTARGVGTHTCVFSTLTLALLFLCRQGLALLHTFQVLLNDSLNYSTEGLSFGYIQLTMFSFLKDALLNPISFFL